MGFFYSCVFMKCSLDINWCEQAGHQRHFKVKRIFIFISFTVRPLLCHAILWSNVCRTTTQLILQLILSFVMMIIIFTHKNKNSPTICITLHSQSKPPVLICSKHNVILAVQNSTHRDLQNTKHIFTHTQKSQIMSLQICHYPPKIPQTLNN